MRTASSHSGLREVKGHVGKFCRVSRLDQGTRSRAAHALGNIALSGCLAAIPLPITDMTIPIYMFPGQDIVILKLEILSVLREYLDQKMNCNPLPIPNANSDKTIIRHSIPPRPDWTSSL